MLTTAAAIGEVAAQDKEQHEFKAPAEALIGGKMIWINPM
jgi:hypothetical protein